MKSPIVSTKHIVQHTQFAVASAAVVTFTEAEGLHIVDVNNQNEVIEGSIIKAVYVEIWLLSSTANPASFVMILEKSPANNNNPTFTNMTTLNSYENKKNVLYITQGLVAEQTGNPTPVFRGWIKIPKGKQRFGYKDEFKVSIAGIGSDSMTGCGMSIYKDYR